MKKESKKFRPVSRLKPEEYLRRYLKVAPLALAIFRSLEAKNIARVRIERPILDMGCGFGEFAGVFFKSQIEMGLDVSWDELVSARKGKKYKNLIWADAREVPFKDDYFGTVLSVSVLEHIKKPQPVIDEVFRVLKPGGQFVFTVNANKLSRMLYWPGWLKDRGLTGLAKKYPGYYHRLFDHQTLWSEKKWRQVLKGAGFKKVKIQEIISPEATRMFDKFLITSWPSQLIKLITGRRWAWRPEWFREWLVKKYGYLVAREEKEGSNLFVTAVKPARK